MAPPAQQAGTVRGARAAVLGVFGEGGQRARAAALLVPAVFFALFFGLLAPGYSPRHQSSSERSQPWPYWRGLWAAAIVLCYGMPWLPGPWFHMPFCRQLQWSSVASAACHLAAFALSGGVRAFLLAPLGAVSCALLALLPGGARRLLAEHGYTAEHLLVTAAVLALRPPGMALLGDPPPASIVAMMLMGCVVTALILNQWSEAVRKGSDDHRVVRGYVDGTGTPREALGWGQLGRLGALSLFDAAGQEMIWRGLFLHELLASGAFGAGACNVLQAVSFGAVHWHGIPSGWSGMGLTFVYGWFMGWLVLTLRGMGLALLVHWCADFFIYTVIARKKFGD